METPDSVDVFLNEVSMLRKVAESLPLQRPSMQSSSNQVTLQIATITNTTGHCEHKGFTEKFLEEIGLLRQMEIAVDEGNEFVQFLYCYRSISKAIPELQIDVTDEMSRFEKAQVKTKKVEYSKTLIDVLRPGMMKIKEFAAYVVSATQIVRDCIVYLVNLQATSGTVPEGLYVNLVKLVDTLVKLDNIKDIKSSLKNDFNRYKRACASLGNDVAEELAQIQAFLASPDPKKARNYIYSTMREEVKRIVGHEEVVMAILSYACEALEKYYFFTPEEKFELIRIIPHLIILCDGDADDPKSFNVFKQYKSRLGNAQSLMKRYPVVPLYGDMTITADFVLERAAHYDSNTMGSQWMGWNNAEEAGYDICSYWPIIRKSYDDFVTVFQDFRNHMNLHPFLKVHSRDNAALAAEAVDIVYNGFAKISRWTSTVRLAISWKFAHPITPPNDDDQRQHNQGENDDEDDPIPGIEYSRALKENLNKSELTALGDIIAMIKSLSSMMREFEAVAAPMIRFHIHHDIQVFVQGDILPLLHRLDKRRKSSFNDVITLRSIAVDWLHGIEPKENFKTYTSRQGHVDIAHTPRVVGPSHTQLQLVRSYVREMFDEKSELRKKEGLLLKADMYAEDVKTFELFYHESFFYPYYMSYSSTLKSVSDLSDLWFREFFLEVTRCIQFPIDMSLPWLITEQLLSNQSKNTTSIEDIIYILDIYNDCSHRALFEFRQQHLYDEIEAETNLVFDQLVFLIAEEVYLYYKNISSSVIIDRIFKDRLEKLKQSHYMSVYKNRYDALLSQRVVHLIGRDINLTHLISQHINNKFLNDIDVAVRRFESCDLTGVVELRVLLDILQTTHNYISNSCGLQIDPFETMFHRVNETFSSNTFRGRMTFHVLRNLIMDLFPNHAYNAHTQRFVRCPIATKSMEYRKSPKQKAMTLIYGQSFFKPFEHFYRLSRGFIGSTHYECLLDLSAFIDLGTVLDECSKNLFEQLQKFSVYVEVLKQEIPLIMLPQYQQHSSGNYAYFKQRLRSVLDYEDLKTEVFQGLKEIGNTIAFFKDLSVILDIRDGLGFVLSSSLSGVPPITKKPENHSHISTSDSPIVQILNSLSLKSKVANRKQQQSSSESAASRNTKELQSVAIKAVRGLIDLSSEHKSLFKGLLKHIEESMYSLNLFNDWSANVNESIMMDVTSMESHGSTRERNRCLAFDVEKTNAFHKLWSIFCFLYNLPVKLIVNLNSSLTSISADDVITDEEQFGHGFFFAGCTLIHLLQQQSHLEVTDFSAHVLRVYENELALKLKVTQTDENLLRECHEFMKIAVEFKKIQMHIFDTLSAAKLRGTENKKKVSHIRPME